MIERSVLVVDENRAYHLADVGNLASSAYDDGSWRDNLLAVGILLCQRQRVFTCRNIDVEVAAEVAQRLYSTVETCILTLL